MRTHYNPKNNPRVIIIQKLYGKFYNEDDDLNFPKHRFKKFIKDTMLQIKDLEKELEFMHSREPDEYKYIAFLEKRIDELYKKAEKLDEIN